MLRCSDCRNVAISETPLLSTTDDEENRNDDVPTRRFSQAPRVSAAQKVVLRASFENRHSYHANF